MPKTLTATDRKSLIRLASSLEKGSPERRAILAGLKGAAAFRWHNGKGEDFLDDAPSRLQIRGDWFYAQAGIGKIEKALKGAGYKKMRSYDGTDQDDLPSGTWALWVSELGEAAVHESDFDDSTLIVKESRQIAQDSGLQRPASEGARPQKAAPEILRAMAMDNEMDPDYLTRTYSRTLAVALSKMVGAGFNLDSEAIEVLGAGGATQFREEYGDVKGFRAVNLILEKAFADNMAAL